MVSEEENRHNPYRDVWLNVQKSAEAIVANREESKDKRNKAGREGLNNGSLTSERRVKQC